MTLPSIPDNLYKLLILAGAIFLAYGYVDNNRSCDRYFAKVDFFNSSIDSFNIQVMQLDHQRQKLSATADFLSKRNNIPNPIEIKDSLIFFHKLLLAKRK